MKTLEQYLRGNMEKNIIDHEIRARIKNNGDIAFYIHAANADSDTLDFVVNGNCLFRDPDIK